MPLLLVFLGGLGSGWWATTETVEATTGGSGKANTIILLLALLAVGYAWRKGVFK